MRFSEWFRFGIGFLLAHPQDVPLVHDMARHRVNGPHCLRCGTPFPHAPVSHLCTHCLKSSAGYDGHRALWSFAPPVRQAVFQFKYHNALWWKHVFAAELKLNRPDLPDFDVIVPVPLHVSRLRERGYNQSLEWARVVAKVYGRPVNAHGLKRGRATPSQTGLSRTARQMNVEGAFEIDRWTRDKPGSVLLVDDVHTTGATLNEAALVLKQHEIPVVWALSLALVKGDR